MQTFYEDLHYYSWLFFDPNIDLENILTFNGCHISYKDWLRYILVYNCAIYRYWKRTYSCAIYRHWKRTYSCAIYRNPTNRHIVVIFIVPWNVHIAVLFLGTGNVTYSCVIFTSQNCVILTVDPGKLSVHIE